MKFCILVLWILFGADLVWSQIGDQCTSEQTNSAGTCKRIDKCQEVMNDVRSNKPYTRCGFQRRVELVCCPEAVEPRISDRMCVEYSKAVYTKQRIKGKSIQVNRCGNKVTPLIVGGENASPREFPHMTLLGYNDGRGKPSWTCGGSLISDEFILTAAHCTRTPHYGNVSIVRLGEFDISTTTDITRTEDFEVAEIIMHPRYTAASHYNDIALLKLARKVRFDAYKRPACLATANILQEKHAIATGWGHTDFSASSSNILQKVTLQLFALTQCQATHPEGIDTRLQDGIRDEKQICAGHNLTARDTCKGDSGGPLQVFHSTQYCMYTIIGVTSFGSACGNLGQAGVYTRVHGYLDWIEGIVWPNA